MGKSSSVTIGYRYKVAYHHGLAATPIDAFLQFRAADGAKIAWQGKLTASGTIHINKPGLFGGDKDQGGIVGDVDVMFGEATQQKNPYLTATFGDKQSAWRGVTTLAFKGGVYGAMNPYPQKPSYQILCTKAGWDDPGCWYPEKAEVALHPEVAFTNDLAFPATQASLDGTYAGIRITGVSERDVIIIAKPPGLTYKAWSRWSTDSNPDAAGLAWSNDFWVTDGNNVTTHYWDASYANPDEAEAAFSSQFIQLGGSTSYTVWLYDTPVNDNRGGLSLRIYKNGVMGLNPAHVLYDLRTALDRGAEPRSNMNDASWRAGADWFWSQGIGLCTEFDPDTESPDDAITRIEKLCNCSVNLSPVDGQWYLDIANGVYDLNNLPVLTDDDILEWCEKPTTIDDAINSVSVEYYDPQLWATVTSPPVKALALITTNGLNHDVKLYHEIPTAALADRMALRDLQGSITPTRSFLLTTNRKPARWRRNTYFRLQTPKRGIADMVCLLVEKDTGTLKSGAVKITAAQDIYGMPATSFVSGEPGVDTRPSQIPVPIVTQVAVEAPYFELVRNLSPPILDAMDADAGYLMTMAADPAVSRDYAIAVSIDGVVAYHVDANAQWCPTAMVVEPDPLKDAAPLTAFTLSDGVLLDRVVAGSAAMWGNEIVRVDVIDASIGTVTLGRGCADTVASPHAANERIWFFDGYFGTDNVQYGSSETVDIKLLTNTGSDQLNTANALVMPLTFEGRAARPYPPGKLRVGGNPYPSTVAGEFAVVWSHRNRVLQADQLVDDNADDVTPADNTRYRLALKDSTGAVLIERDDIGPGTATVSLDYTGDVTLELSTIDANGESLQHHTVTFAYTPLSPAPSQNIITATPYEPVVPTWNVDGNLGA